MATALERQDLDAPFMIKTPDEHTVAVYMITYNHKPYIRQAIESVMLQQTSFAVKLFIGDDKSTDGTTDICYALVDKYPGKIDFTVNSTNLGASKNAIKTFNKCFCSGARYIALLEGDDYWTDPLKLQKQVDFLEKNPAIVCHCHNAKILENGQLTMDYNPIFTPRELTRRDVITNSGIPTASVTFRNVFNGEMPDYLLKKSMDIILYFSLASHGNFYMSNEFMSVYRLHPGGTWSGQDLQLRDKKLVVIFSHILNHLPLNDDERNDIYHNIIQLKQRRIKLYANKFHFGFTYFKDVFYLIGAKLKGRDINLNYLLHLMCPKSITSFLGRSTRK